MSAKHWNYNN